jgi:hypothetical protein
MKYQIGEQVFWLKDGQEFPATVLNRGEDHAGAEIYMIEVEGIPKHVKMNELLAAKKAGFEIRDLAYVIDVHRDAVQGEIVAIGNGPKNRTFYQLKFDPAVGHAQSWYSEDEVFIVSPPTQEIISQFEVDESLLSPTPTINNENDGLID